MFTFVVIVMMIISLLLVGIVLIQNSKSDGMGNSLNAMGGNKLVGVKRSSDAVEKTTWILSLSLFSLAIIANQIIKKERLSKNFSANVIAAQKSIVNQ